MKITAQLASSIAITRPEDLALDGLLASQMLRRHFGEEFYFLPDPKELLHFARLPLAMRGKPSERIATCQTGEIWWQTRGQTDESCWYWACSSAQVEVQARDTEYWNKRFDTQAGLSDRIDFGGRVEKVLIEQGRYKAYHMPLPKLVTDCITWYAVGDIEPVLSLLQPLVAIGKKRAYGNGAIRQWHIAPLEEDWSEWRDHRLMRPLPAPLARAIQWDEPPNIQHIAYRAPQWHPLNHALCVVGGKRHAI
jgi:CRISPR type IV-associated protein Csf3